MSNHAAYKGYLSVGNPLIMTDSWYLGGKNGLKNTVRESQRAAQGVPGCASRASSVRGRRHRLPPPLFATAAGLFETAAFASPVQ
jgi:hypothetical protein